MDGKKIAKYMLLGVGAYFVIKVLLSLFNIVFNIAFKILVLVAIVAFISYLLKKN